MITFYDWAKQYDTAQFKRITIPLVRRIYPQMIASKIVSVQPLLGPSGLLYYLRHRYSSNKGYNQDSMPTFASWREECLRD